MLLSNAILENYAKIEQFVYVCSYPVVVVVVVVVESKTLEF